MERQKANVPISSDVDLPLVYCPTSLRKFILIVDRINTVSIILIVFEMAKEMLLLYASCGS